MTNEPFKKSLSKSIDGGTKYSNYNKHILEAGNNTATINNKKNKGWFHFSWDYLLLLIKERDSLISDYRTLGIGKRDSSEAKLQLKVAQLAVDDAIALENQRGLLTKQKKCTQYASIRRKHGRVFVFSLEETQATMPHPLSCSCDYSTGNWKQLMQKMPPYLDHTSTGSLTFIDQLIDQC